MEIRCSVRSSRRHSTECVQNHTLTQLFGNFFMNEEPRIAKGKAQTQPTEFDRRKYTYTHAQYAQCEAMNGTRNNRAVYASTHRLSVSYVVNSILSVVQSSAHRVSVLEIDVVIALLPTYTFVSIAACVCLSVLLTWLFSLDLWRARWTYAICF